MWRHSWSPSSTEAGWLPVIAGNRYLLNILCVAAITIGMYIYLTYSKHGYEISVVGESVATARYVGIKVGWTIVRTLMLSGAICGFTGYLLVAGTDHTLTTTLAGGQGFTAVMVAWLAKFHPLGIIASEFFILYKLHFRGFSRKTEKNAENTASQMNEKPSAGRQSGPEGSDNEEEKREDSANV